MNEERTTRIATVSTSKIFYSQRCLCCENTRRLPDGMTYSHTSWICDECKEAIAFLKDFKHKQESIDPLKPILD